ncbi:MAG: tetratricopeptide repeat protein [Anaerolineae bacterium]|nr:tetratricopeptide repeat protein [Anaerolineae bacterium]
MSFFQPTGWAEKHSRKSQQRFAQQFLAYAETHWQEHDVLQRELPNLRIAINLLIRQQSPVQTAEMISSLSSLWLAQGYWQEALDYFDHARPLLDRWHSERTGNQQVELGWGQVQVVAVMARFLQGLHQEARESLQCLLRELHLEDKSASLLLLLFAGLVNQSKEESRELNVLYDEWLVRIREIENLSMRGAALDLIARQLADQGDVNRSLELLREKMEIDSQRHDIYAICETLCSLASVARSAGLDALADDCLQEVMKLSAINQKSEAYAEALRERAAIALKQENYPLASDLYREILAMARQRKSKPAIANTLRLLVFAAEELGQSIDSLLEESLSVSRDIGDYAGMIRSWIQLGTLAQEQGKADQAQDQFEKARNLAEQIQDQELLALAWQSLGELAEERENWIEARHCYERCLEVSNDMTNSEGRALALRNLGHVLINLRDIDLAVNMFSASAEIHARTGDWESYAGNLYDLAYVAALEGRAEDTREFYQQCVTILRRIGSTHLEEIDEAKQHLEQTLASSSAHNLQLRRNLQYSETASYMDSEVRCTP